MGLRHSDHAIAHAILWLFLSLVFCTSMIAQNTAACPIRTNQTVKTQQSYRIMGEVEQKDNFGKNPWTNVANILMEDDQMSTTKLIPWNRSYQLKFDNFDFNIPTSSYIEGIRLTMKGYAVGEGKVSDLEIYLLDEFGNPKGVNKANRNFNGNNWPLKDSTDLYEWNYGYDSDLWGEAWTPEQVNDENFGIIIQLVNLTPEQMELFLDNIMLQVYFSSPLNHCNAACIPYYVNEVPGAIDYIWSMPNGFEEHPDVGGLKNVVNMYPVDANYGTYELCVSTVFPNETSDPCCRKIEYSNCQKGAIGDFVYEDLNANGIHEINEPPLEGIKLNLHSGDLWKINSTKSNFAGYYSFQSLEKAEYLLSIDIPEGYGASDQSSILNAYLQNGTDVLQLNYGQNLNNVDFGLYKYASISGMVWEDFDGDGAKDLGEGGLETKVNLHSANGDLVTSIQTDSDGNYVFTNLVPGDYFLSFDTPEGNYIITLEGATTDDLDSDIRDINGQLRTDLLTLQSGDEVKHVDAGFRFENGNFEGLVWRDNDGDGDLDGNEPMLEEVEVKLFDCNGDLIDLTRTNNQGHYTFGMLDPSQSYYISCELLNGYAYSFAPGDTGITHENGTGTSKCYDINPGQIITINAGLAPTGNIGDYVWLDQNENGFQDDNESGIADVKVILRDVFKNHIDSTITDNEGNYNFSNIYPATYSVIIETMPDFKITSFNALSGSPIVSKFIEDGNIYRTYSFNIFNGKNKDNIDAGFILEEGEIVARVWNDANGNGVLDAVETGMSDILVQLYDCDDILLDEVITDQSGEYRFFNIKAGIEYYVKIEATDDYAFGLNGDSDLSNLNGEGSSSCIMLTPNGVIDFNLALVPYSSIGDFVWLDENRNGLQDSNESGMELIELQLLDENKELLSTTLTNDLGYYLFDEILPGKYTVQILMPDGQLSMTSFQTSNDDELDSDFQLSGQHLTSQELLLSDGIDLINVDCGLVETSLTIGGELWSDGNGDGEFDPNEKNLEGFTVELHHCTNGLIDQSTTDQNGRFQFDISNPLGEYFYKFLFDDSNYTASINTMINNENGIGTTGCLSAIDWSNQTSLGALVPFGSIGDFVWLDSDKDGQQDADETGFENITIGLYDINDQLLYSSTTDENGFYKITQIYPGSYYAIIENLPEGFEVSPYQQTQVNNNDSDFELVNGIYRTELFLLLNGNYFDQIDAGLYSTISSISGLVFEDLLADGQRDVSDLGMPNIEVNLLSDNGMINATTITDDEGKYLFNDLLPGSYYVQFELLSDYLFTDADKANDNSDSDVTGSTYTSATDVIDLQSGQTMMHVDAGVYTYGNIGDFIWNDDNQNGIQDNNEPGIEGILIEAFDTDNVSVGSATSDQQGFYDLRLLPGTYSLFISAGLGNVFTMSGIGGDGDLDSDFTSNGSSFGAALNISVFSGQMNTAIDAGIIIEESTNIPAQINGYVWEDDNGDGLRIDEEGTNDIKVVLIDNMGILVASVYSGFDENNQSGYYEFVDVPEGDYYLEFQIPQNPQMTEANIGNDAMISSSLTGSNGSFTTETLQVLDNNTYHMNGGYYHYVSIGDYVWNDTSNDGIQNIDEIGVNDVLLRLLDKENNVVSIKSTKFNPATSLPGFYEFSNIPPGDYHVLISLQEGMFVSNSLEGADDNLDSDIDHSNGPNTTRTISIFSGQKNDHIDIGLVQEPGQIGSRLWIDSNGNGVQDAAESGLNDVEVRLYTETDVFVKSTLTHTDPLAGDGFYLFEDIQPGNYYVQFLLPPGYLSTLSDKGGDDTMDSDITNFIAPGTTNIFNLNPSEANLDADGGIYLPSTVGDFIWLDDNENGIQDDDEIGLEGILVSIEKTDEVFSMSTRSDEYGFYQFDGLRPGSYFLKFERPMGKNFVNINEGSNASIDSDVDINGLSETFYLQYNTDVLNMDAGLVNAEIIVGDRVWFDANENGLQDFDEVGLADVEVRLLDGSLDLIESVKTNGLGEYLFINPTPGDYFVEILTPIDYEFTAQKVGFDVYTDSDFDENGRSDRLYLTPGIYLPTVDAGLKLKGSIAPEVGVSGLSITGKFEKDKNSLEWRDINPTDGSMYEIHRVVSYGNSKMIHNEDVNNEIEDYGFIDTQVTKGGMYVYQIYKKNAKGYLIDMATTEIFVPHRKYKQTRLHPNPVVENFSVSVLDDKQNYTDLWIDLIILNNSGKQVKRLKIKAGEKINLSQLSPGLYNVITDLGYQKDFHQLIKQ